MPTQLDHLLNDELRARLRAGDRSAHAELAVCFNRRHPPNRQIDVPKKRTSYRRYDIRLLAMLWALVGDQAALEALAVRLNVPLPTPPDDHAGMHPTLLQTIWTHGRLDHALEAYWTQLGLLPVGAVTEDTPAGVLGFLWWHERREAARDELFRRHHNHRATDYAQNAAQGILRAIPRWDYLNYPDPRGLFNRCARNAAIEEAGRRVPEPASDRDDLSNPADQTAIEPVSGVANQEELQRLVEVERRIIYKVRNNSEIRPQELNPDELTHAARRTLEHYGRAGAAATTLDRVRARIARWMATHPEPTADQMQQCFPWYDEVAFDQASRAWRLGWRADENNRILAPLRSGAVNSAADGVQTAMDELAYLVALGRPPGKKYRGRRPVQVFADLQMFGATLAAELNDRDRTDAADDAVAEWQENLAAFCAEFPVLTRLAPCLRLASWLMTQSLPNAARVALGELLQGNRNPRWPGLRRGRWLKNFSRAGREEVRRLTARLQRRLPRAVSAWRSALQLLILWLRSLRGTRPAERRLLDLDRVWWLSRAPGWPGGLAAVTDELIAAACNGRSEDVAAQAAVLLDELRRQPGGSRLGRRELEDSSHRLAR